MKSYTQLRNLAGQLTNNSASANLTLMDQLINDSIRRICGERDWPFLQKSATTTTTAGTQFYALPYDYDKLIDVYITNGTTKYIPLEAPSQTFWDQLNQQTSFQSNFPEYYYIFNGQLGFYPTPSTSSLTITYNYRRSIVDLNRADYTTGTIAATNGSTTITGSGTTWTSPMVGRYISITVTDTAASSGDGVWYQIATVASATSATIVKAYNGTTITGGAFTIGQMPILPEAYQDAPVYEAAYVYYTSINPDATRATLFKTRFDDLHTRLIADFGMKSTDPVIHDASPIIMQNPNLFVSL